MCCHTPLYMLPIQISSSPISLPLTIVFMHYCMQYARVDIRPNNSKYIFHRHLRANQGQKILPAPAAQISAWNCQSQIDSCILFMHILNLGAGKKSSYLYSLYKPVKTKIDGSCMDVKLVKPPEMVA